MFQWIPLRLIDDCDAVGYKTNLAIRSFEDKTSIFELRFEERWFNRIANWWNNNKGLGTHITDHCIQDKMSLDKAG